MFKYVWMYKVKQNEYSFITLYFKTNLNRKINWVFFLFYFSFLSFLLSFFCVISINQYYAVRIASLSCCICICIHFAHHLKQQQIVNSILLFINFNSKSTTHKWLSLWNEKHQLIFKRSTHKFSCSDTQRDSQIEWPNLVFWAKKKQKREK